MKKRIQAFTIVELLVVISVLAIVLSMLSPALRKTMEQVKARECQNNLSTISSAIFIYIQDHDNHLMGPVWGAQRPKFRHPKGWKYAHFSYYLEPYMSEFSKVGEDGVTYNSAFICPANSELEMQGLELVHHRSHYRNTINNFINNKPLYGRPQFKSNGTTHLAKDPLSYDVIDNPSEMEILVDSDLDNTPWLDDKPIYDYSDEPVHEKAYRNNLYFDGSVRIVDWTP